MRHLVLIGLLFPIVAGAERLLLAECHVPEGDQYFDAGTRLIMVFAVESSSESIWIEKNGEVEPYAGDSPEAPFEVNGGVWSITLASDVRRTLRNLHFRFVDGTLPLAITEQSGEPGECVMDYSQIERYESGAWVNDDDGSSEN